MPASPSKADERRGIQSLEIGIRLFQTVHRLKRPVTLNELAKLSRMPPSKAHRYCVSLIRTGLLQQDGRGLYAIGPFGFQLSHAQADLEHARRLALAALPALVRQTGETVFLAAWGEIGPTILRVEDAPKPISIRPTMQGDLPVHNSATGRVFAAFMDEARMRTTLERDLQRFREQNKGSAADAAARLRAFLRLLPDVRRRKLARTTGERYPGLVSFSAPVFDPQGQVVLAITSFGLATTFPSAWDAPVARALAGCAAELTRRIGGAAPAR